MANNYVQKGVAVVVSGGLSAVGAAVAGPIGAALGGGLGGLIAEVIGEDAGYGDALDEASVDISAFVKKAEAHKATKAAAPAKEQAKAEKENLAAALREQNELLKRFMEMAAQAQAQAQAEAQAEPKTTKAA